MTYNMMTVFNNIVYLKVAKRGALKSSHHKEKNCNCEMMDVN